MDECVEKVCIWMADNFLKLIQIMIKQRLSSLAVPIFFSNYKVHCLPFVLIKFSLVMLSEILGPSLITPLTWIHKWVRFARELGFICELSVQSINTSTNPQQNNWSIALFLQSLIPTMVYCAVFSRIKWTHFSMYRMPQLGLSLSPPSRSISLQSWSHSSGFQYHSQ